MASPIKKKKPFRSFNPATKKRYVDPGSRGLFFTCEAHEKEAIKEARNLIDQYLNLVDDNELNDDANANGEDISETLGKMCKEASSSKTNFPKLLPTGAKNCLFFEMSYLNFDELYLLADKILAGCQSEAQCRFLQRILPIEETCSTDIKDVSNAISNIIRRHFKNSSGDQSKLTYAVDFKSRNNNQLSRAVVLDMVDTFIKATTTDAKVNLSEPNLTIIVHVSNKAVMLACLKNFIQRRKFSLHVPATSASSE